MFSNSLIKAVHVLVGFAILSGLSFFLDTKVFSNVEFRYLSLFNLVETNFIDWFCNFISLKGFGFIPFLTTIALSAHYLAPDLNIDKQLLRNGLKKKLQKIP